jgi:HD superfamily phosphodiesterase
MRILQEHRLPGPVLEHVQTVARVSGRIAEYMNSRGYRLHLGIVMAASLLHDIARGEKDHVRKGSHLVASLGYSEVADIIASHMEVSGHQVVSIDERLKDRLNQFSEEAAQQAARERMGQAMTIQKRIEGILDLRLESILDEHSERVAGRRGTHHGDKT